MHRLPAGIFAAVAAISILALSVMPNSAEADDGVKSDPFKYIFPLEGISWYPSADMVANCGGTYDDAKARIWVDQYDGETHVTVIVSKAAPNTLWTIWLRLDQPSELTGAMITALANPEDTSDLAKITPDSGLTQAARDLGMTGDSGVGADDAANVFWTDDSGTGTYYIKLSYPLVRGAVQFQEYDDSLARAAIGDTPFRLRIASHCADNKAHGLLPGFHEMWFDWK